MSAVGVPVEIGALGLLAILAQMLRSSYRVEQIFGLATVALGVLLPPAVIGVPSCCCQVWFTIVDMTANPDERFPTRIDTVPTCDIVEQWKRTEPDGSETIRYAGADGYLYESRGPQGWFQVGKWYVCSRD